MKLLIVTATEMELSFFKNEILYKYIDNENIHITLLNCGVGMVATSYYFTKHLQHNKYDFILQAGVGGSFKDEIELGTLAFITSEQFGDLGAEDHENYLNLFDLGLANKDIFPFTNGKLLTPNSPIHNKINLPHFSGLTINTVSGSDATIIKRKSLFNCDIESMEGAAFHYICLLENMPFAQIRAVSNYVLPRDKSKWKMKEAIINLNNWIADFVEFINVKKIEA